MNSGSSFSFVYSCYITKTVTVSTLNWFKRNLKRLRNSTKMDLLWTEVVRLYGVDLPVLNLY